MARTRVSLSRSGQPQRLPVNPRRHKVKPENRKRVATACNSCNVRRIKCSGERPCSQCSNAHPPRDCQYPAVVEKVTLPKSELEELKTRCAALQRMVDTYVPTSHRSRGTSSSPELTFAPSPPGSDDETGSISPLQAGRILQDPDGNARYLGETSGATFLDHMKEFLITLFPLAFQSPYPGPGGNTESAFLASVGQYQTHDSRPLFEPDLPLDSKVNPIEMPPRTEMTARLLELRYFLQDGNGGYPSGGIWFWGNLSAIPFFTGDEPAASSSLDAATLARHRHLALYQTAFAVAYELGVAARSQQNSPHPDAEDSTGLSGSLPFFLRARALIGNPLDVTAFSVGDVNVLALMALYLLEKNRRDAAYMYVSVAMHICIAHGVHRGWIINEQGKRTFWTVFVLDRYLACLMGRPPTIRDDAVRLDLPADVIGLPPAAGLRAHVELARISGHIVCNTYRISPSEHSPSRIALRMDRDLQMLDDWVQELPPILRIDSERPSQCNDRGALDLHMSYNQLIILAVRPAFFLAIKQIINERYPSTCSSSPCHPPQLRAQTHFPSCGSPLETHVHAAYFHRLLVAARTNLLLARHLATLSPTQKLLQPELHHTFNAAVVLLLAQLASPTLLASDAADIQFAVTAFTREAHANSNYGVDCAKVLRDLTNLVQRIRELASSQTTTPTPATSLATPTSGIGLGEISTAVSPLLSVPASSPSSLSISSPTQVPMPSPTMAAGVPFSTATMVPQMSAVCLPEQATAAYVDCWPAAPPSMAPPPPATIALAGQGYEELGPWMGEHGHHHHHHHHGHQHHGHGHGHGQEPEATYMAYI